MNKTIFEGHKQLISIQIFFHILAPNLLFKQSPSCFGITEL